MPRKLGGFSLIEMAVVLMIIGLIGGMTMPALKIMLDWQKTATTVERQEKILYGLASYALQNKTLPYAGSPVDLDGKQDKTNKRRRGIIPFRDLGIPESFVKDGYGRWFTYVMDDRYGVKSPPKGAGNPTHPDVMHEASLSQLCKEFSQHNLSIKLPQEGTPKGIALALISHGAEGRGAYPNAANNPPQGEDEQLNTQSESLLVDRPLSKDPANPFSHKVIWITGKYLMALYGRFPCPAENQMFAHGAPKAEGSKLHLNASQKPFVNFASPSLGSSSQGDKGAPASSGKPADNAVPSMAPYSKDKPLPQDLPASSWGNPKGGTKTRS